jgi:hypothetical protein
MLMMQRDSSLRRNSLPEIGRTFSAGETFAEFGDFHENGNWL